MNTVQTQKSLENWQCIKEAKQWPVLSLFSGAGGLDLGFHNAGFTPRLAIDNNPAAVATYRYNHPNSTVVMLDLSETTPETILNLWDDITGGISVSGIIGGPPCQGFSQANMHQHHYDPRRQLVINYANIIKTFAIHRNLEFFVLENVPGITYNKHKHLLTKVKETTIDAGFNVYASVLNAGKFGVPQNRKRLIMAGINAKKYPTTELELPNGHCTPPNIASAIAGLPEPAYHTRKLNTDAIPYHPNHITSTPRSSKFTNGSLAIANNNGLSFKVLDWNAPSYTVAYGHNEIHIHPNCHRRLSVYEAMLLQGFPHQYQLLGTFREQVQMISNAVPPPMSEGIAKSIAQTLGYVK